MQRLVDETLERHGRIDLLVNNAGGQFLSPAEDITPKGFRTVMKLNVEGTWLMTHAVATKAMIPAGGDFFSGSVLTIDGACDNWHGPWPPPFAALDDGQPLTEARRPQAAEQP